MGFRQGRSTSMPENEASPRVGEIRPLFLYLRYAIESWCERRKGYGMEALKGSAEHRVILHNTSWETYERLLEERGEERVPRFFYDRGEVEIVSPSAEPERVGFCVGLIVAMFAREGRVVIYGVGSTTFRREDLARGFEPDLAF